MLTASLDHTDVQSLAIVSRQDHAPAVCAERVELVEWEMTAGQVGSLVAAMSLVFGLVWLVG